MFNPLHTTLSTHLVSLNDKVPVDNSGLDNINKVEDRQAGLDALVLETVDLDVLASLREPGVDPVDDLALHNGGAIRVEL